MGFVMLSCIPIYQMPSPPQSREHSPIRSQLPTSPLATRKVLSQLPQAPNRKHYLCGLSEPVAKRPTLAQRAGDFSSENAAAPPSQQPVNHAVTTTATAGPPRFNVSTSTRASPPRGRSLTSFSASVGPGVRPQNTITSTLPRPAAAHGRIPRQTKPTTNTKGTGLQIARQKSFTARGDTSAIPNGVSSARSLMTSSTREGFGQAPTAKGKPIFPSFSKPAFGNPFKHHNPHDIPRIDARVISFSSKPIPVSPLPKCITGFRELSISSALQSLSLEARSSSDSLREESPSKLPKPVTPAPALLPAPLALPRSRRKSPPKLKRYLTRDTTTTAWDPDDMFASMERVMSESLGKLQQNTQESSSMKELLEMYKARCEFRPVFIVKMQAHESMLIIRFRSRIGEGSCRIKLCKPDASR
jgi:hypothetical protein